MLFCHKQMWRSVETIENKKELINESRNTVFFILERSSVVTFLHFSCSSISIHPVQLYQYENTQCKMNDDMYALCLFGIVVICVCQARKNSFMLSSLVLAFI